MTQEFVTLRREVVEQALEAWVRGCPPDCKDGMTDSGGTHPWGEAALIQCPACQAVEALRAALDQPQDHIPDDRNMVPAGWKLVPVEPTHDMQEAGIDAHYEAEKKMQEPNAWEPGGFAKRKVRASHVYCAMISAAPEPQNIK